MSYDSGNDNRRWNNTGRDYSPEMDSAFIVDEPVRQTSQPRPRPNQNQADQAAYGVNPDMQARPRQGTNQRPRQNQQQRPQGAAGRRPRPANGAQGGPQLPPERPKRTRTYDPDQMISDEEFLDSYNTEGGGRRKLDEDDRRPVKNSNKKKKRKKKHRVLKIILVVLLVIVLLLGLGIWNITRKFNHIDTEVSKRSDSMKHDVINILLVGEDARDGQTGQRTDTIIVLSLNRKKNITTMTSIMRDTYVNIPGHGGDRINAAYAYGGLDLLDQTIEENFGITIDGNMKVDFDGFLEAMSAVGSLDMELTAEEAQYMNENPALGSNNDESDEVWNLKEGVNKLTPSQILCYSRMRYVGNSDWDRTERQRKVIAGVTSQVKHGHFIKGYKVASKAAPYISTDLKTGGMMKLAWNMVFGKETDSHLIPAEGTYYADNINGMAVLVPDIDANKAALQRYINGEE